MVVSRGTRPRRARVFRKSTVALPADGTAARRSSRYATPAARARLRSEQCVAGPRMARCRCAAREPARRRCRLVARVASAKRAVRRGNAAMMRRLELDFLSATRSPSWPGPVLLVAGLLCGAMVAVQYVEANAERERLQTQQTDAHKLLRR